MQQNIALSIVNPAESRPTPQPQRIVLSPETKSGFVKLRPIDQCELPVFAVEIPVQTVVLSDFGGTLAEIEAVRFQWSFSAMSSSVSCPKCGGLVQLPAGHLPTDEVQCPACKAEFQISDAADADLADVIPMKADDDFDLDDLQEIPFDPDLKSKKGDDEFDIEPMSKTSNADGVADDPLDAMLEEALFEDDKGGKPNVGEQFIEEASHSSDAADEEEAIVDLTEDDTADAELAHDAGDAMSAAFEPVEPHAESAAHAEGSEDEPWDFGKEAAMPKPAKSADDEPWNLEPEPTAPKHVAPPPVEPAGNEKAKMPKKPKSMVMEIAKILVGGIVGLVAAYAILIFGLKKDPFGLAPLLPQSILPKELNPVAQLPPVRMPQPQPDENPTPDAATPDAATPDAATPDPTTPANPNDGFAPPPGLAATQPDATPAATDPLNPTPTPTPTAPGADTTATLDPNARIPSLPEPGVLPNATLPATTPPTTASNDALTNPLATPPTPTANPLDATPPATNPGATAADPFATPAPTTSAFPPIPEPAPVAAREPRGIKTDKFSTLAEAQQAIAALDGASDALYNAPGGAQNPEIRKLRGNFYIALAKLAETLAMVSPQDDDKDHALSTAAAERIAEKLTDAFRIGELSQLGGFWLNAPRRTNNGAVLVGVVQDVQPQGKLFKTLVKLADTTSPDGTVQQGIVVPVITAENPQLNPNDSALVLGAIVKDPILNLHQYEGVDPMVVWAANVRRLPPVQ
jgi:hypothetical protein